MLNDVLGRLRDHGLRPAGSDRWQARCPAHDDRTPSLSIVRGTAGRTLVKCHAGCSADAVVQALGLTLSSLFEEDDRAKDDSLPPERWPVVGEHVYHDESGLPVFRVVKRRSPDSGNKTFRQERWNGSGWTPGVSGVSPLPYRLPSLVAQAVASERVWVVEGEKDADCLASLGLVATCNAGGAGKWGEAHAKWLAGRDVIVIPDNDEPGEKHAAAVMDSLRNVAASVGILRLPNLPKKGDVSDWVGAGGTADELRRLAGKVSRGAAFVPSARRLADERAERLALAQHRLAFGVSFLDHSLRGINRRDLILLGAKTGIGKTALATTVALTNAAAGKRVHAFMLEAEDREMERRVKFRVLAGLYYRRTLRPRAVRYLDWYNGELEFEFAPFEKDAERELEKIFANVSTYYRGASFTAEDFEKQLESIQDETDLIVLDHFHYFDSDDDNETRSQRTRAKKIRDCALLAERPVVMVAHVRKQDARNAGLLPTIEDFHGAADLARIPTKTIMLAPDYEHGTGESHLWSTYMQVNKCRQESALSRYVARLTYDIRLEAYQDQYELGRLTDGGRSWEPLPVQEIPQWARADAAPSVDSYI